MPTIAGRLIREAAQSRMTTKPHRRNPPLPPTRRPASHHPPNPQLQVLHRRANLTRPRTIFSMAAKPIPGTNCFALALCTQAGTYIKEFVHGA